MHDTPSDLSPPIFEVNKGPEKPSIERAISSFLFYYGMPLEKPPSRYRLVVTCGRNLCGEDL
jgi:hypothetical protein